MKIINLNFKNISRQTDIKDVLMYCAKEKNHVERRFD